MQKRILVVDDNQAVRLIVRSTFEMQGPFIVHEACDGVDAVEKAQSLNPDLVIMDLSMPRMHGLDATRRLKKEHSPIQVVLFTMHQGALSETDASQAGVDAVVSKSDGLETLLHRVEELLQQPIH
jgi:DNA-binding NarL/FixJ family response regulator